MGMNVDAFRHTLCDAFEVPQRAAVACALSTHDTASEAQDSAHNVSRLRSVMPTGPHRTARFIAKRPSNIPLLDAPRDDSFRASH